jgi:rRNA-processing protein FCF1
MNIIIDTNIFRRDLKIKDRNFDILLDYLAKTNSKIIIPQIVLEEIKGLYKRLLLERTQDFKKAYEKLKSSLVITELNEIKSIPIENEIESYLSFLKERIGFSDDKVILYKNEYLPELVNRAISRKKPLDGKGQQFRDGLLWLSMLDYANSLDDKRIIFISDNPTDFAEKNQNLLNTQLRNEAKEKGIEIVYFKTLSDFAKEHASKVDFISDEWIKDNIDNSILERIFNDIIDSVDEDEIISNLYLDLERNESLTGHINPTDYIGSNILEYYVYEMSDGTLLLNLEVEFEKEYECEIERYYERDSSRYEYRYRMTSMGDFDFEPDFIPSIEQGIDYDYKYASPVFRGKFVLQIKDSKVENYEFKDWDWG